MASTPRKSRFPALALRIFIFAAILAGCGWGGRLVWKQIGPGLFGTKRETKVPSAKVKTASIAEEIVAVVQAAMKFVPKERMILSTNCGMAPMRAEIAAAKLAALGKGAALARQRLA